MTVTPPEAQRRVFPALDTMRALAAVGVLTTHVAFQSGLYSSSLWGTALARLDLGVAIFFVLSGFLLTRPYLLKAKTSEPALSNRNYLWNRVVRIFPVYVVTVVGALLILEPDSTWQAWWTNLTLTAVYFEEPLPDGLTQMWSLSAEVAFYAVLPLLMLTARSRGAGHWRPKLFLGILVAASLVGTVWILAAAGGHLGLEVRALQWLPSFLTWFATGMFMAFVQVDLADRPWRISRVVSQVGTLTGACWTAAGALFLVTCTPLAGPTLLFIPTAQEALTKNLLYALVAAFLVLPAVFAPTTSRFSKVMSSSTLRHIGHISYSLFCCHLIVLDLLVDWRDITLFSGRGAELWILTLGASLLVSEILYLLVEKPFLRLKARPGTTSTPTLNKASVKATKS